MKMPFNSILGPGGLLGGVMLILSSFMLGYMSPATARITNLQVVGGAQDRSVRVSYQFTTASGQTIHSSYNERSRGTLPQVGETFTVYYLPNLPNMTITNTLGQPKQTMVYIGAGLGLVLLVVAGGAMMLGGGRA